MKGYDKLVRWPVLLLVLGIHVQAYGYQQETVTTTPLLVDGVLYVASSEPGINRGHLRAIDVYEGLPLTLWDAAAAVPVAGSDPAQPEDIWPGNQNRFLLTNLSEQLLPLSASQASRLLPALTLDTFSEAEVLLHAVRGRRGGTTAVPAGNREAEYRLGSITHSSPLLVGASQVVPGASHRDRVIYAGAADGLLHAFFVSRWDEGLSHYPFHDPDGGTELWGYLPGSFLPYLHQQPFTDTSAVPAIHLDGSPLVRELFLDLDGDGLRRWYTLLIATGTVSEARQSCFFVLDVTDPSHPALLWENLLPGSGVGRTRGVSSGQCPGKQSECLYLTTDFRATGNDAGLHALAVELKTGELLWQFSTTYAARGPVAEATPAVPALMDIDRDGSEDSLVFGDLSGQLWALALENGQAYGDGPVFTVPGNVDEPIGAPVAVFGNFVVFGTGGVPGSSELVRYGVYSVEVSKEGGALRWYFPLEAGEKIWATPLLDKHGNLVLTTARHYATLLAEPARTAGRIIAMNHQGEVASTHAADTAIIGQAVSSPGVVMTVTLDGGVKQFGTPNRLSETGPGSGSVRIWSWRQR